MTQGLLIAVGIAVTVAFDASHARYGAASALLRHFGNTTSDVQEHRSDVFGRVRQRMGCCRKLRRLARLGAARAFQLETGGGSRGAARRGGVFLTTRDRRFLIKQESKGAIERLTRMADAYERCLDEPTLLPRFVGAYTVHCGGETTYWLVAANVFAGPLGVLRKYDLKGSRVGRRGKPGAATLKDLDAIDDCGMFHGGSAQVVDRLLGVLAKDAEFLRRQNLLDYSLLVGVLKRPRFFRLRRRFFLWRMRSPKTRLARKHGVTSIKLPKSTLVVGIIDILQAWDLAKAIEFAARGSLYGYDSISAVPPRWYEGRFLAFLRSLFLPSSSSRKISSTK